MTMQKLAWLSNPDLKEEVLLRMKQHRAEDSIVQGIYQQYAPEFVSQYKGCLIGCTLPMRQDRLSPGGFTAVDWHFEVERAYGIPFPVTVLLEGVFESLPFEHAAEFAVDSIEAIPVGADLSGFQDQWKAVAPNLKYYPFSANALLTILREAPVPEPVQ